MCSAPIKYRLGGFFVPPTSVSSDFVNVRHETRKRSKQPCSFITESWFSCAELVTVVYFKLVVTC